MKIGNNIISEELRGGINPEFATELPQLYPEMRVSKLIGPDKQLNEIHPPGADMQPREVGDKEMTDWARTVRGCDPILTDKQIIEDMVFKGQA